MKTNSLPRAVALAALAAGLPSLAAAQAPTQVPAILRSAGANASASSGQAGPTDGSSAGPNASAAAWSSSGAPRPAGGSSPAGQPPPQGTAWHATQAAASAASAAPAVPLTMPPRIDLLSPSAPLNAKERHGVALARRWTGAGYLSHADADGVVRFPFGATQPTVVCAPLQVCDLALQPGEVINDINAGDLVRWSILPGLSGSREGRVTHLKIKPMDAGLVTSMTIDTNLRTYSVKLVSTQHQWMPLSAFSYADDTADAWSAYRSVVGSGVGLASAGSTLRSSGGSAADIDFGFTISGDHPSWRPIRAYSSGGKTYIQFPGELAFGVAPALVGLADDGGLFSSRTPQVVNYRSLGNRFVVDEVLGRAELISGVGSSQQRVFVTKDAAR